MLKANNYTKERARHVIQTCFHDLAQRAEDGFKLTSNDPDLELFEQECMAEEAIVELTRASFSRQFSADFTAHAVGILAEYGVDVSELPDAALNDLTDGYSRALAEQQRLFKFRLRERLRPYIPHDPLFAPPSTISIENPEKSALAAQPTGPNLKELVDHYLAEKRASWTDKTLRTNSAKAVLMVEHLGAQTPVTTITPQDVRGYRDAVRRLHRDYRRRAGQGFSAKQTEVVSQRIAPKTAKLIFETCKAFFRWAASDAYVPTNPASEIRVDVTGQPKKVTPKRRPFTAAELKILFSCPVFRGSRSVHHRFQPGDLIIRDAKFWVPILGYYTGARLGEIVQLHLTDVEVDGPYPYIDVNEEGPTGPDDRKHVKSAAGVRRIPLHPDVMALGFAAFVNGRRTAKQGRKRLFHELRFGADGQASTTTSKWFGRLLGSCGLDDPSLVFHSFRHGVQDAFKNALTPQYVTDRIVGHADGKVSSGYGVGTSLAVNAEAVRALKLPVSLVGIIAPTS